MPLPRALPLAKEFKAVQLYEDGYSRRQIAKFFAVSDTAVGNALRRRGAKFRERKAAATLGLQHWKRARRAVRSVFELAHPHRGI